MNCDKILNFDSLSVLDVSLCISEGWMGRTSVNCPLVPLLVPFFHAFDTWVKIQWSRSMESERSALMFTLLDERDNLWELLSLTIPFGFPSDSRFCFEPTHFIVQWSKMLKSLYKIEESNAAFEFDRLILEKKRIVDRIAESISSAVFDISDSRYIINEVVPKWPSPVPIPKLRTHWCIVHALRQLSSSMTLNSWNLLECRGLVNIKYLLEAQHFLLFTPIALKRNF